MPDYYRTLELDPGASEQDIKRAYFRLIRAHTPDADPEGFMRIREAYEALKSGNAMKAGPYFPELTDPVANVIRNSIEEALSTRNMAKVMELGEFAVKQFPNEPYFLYHLQIAQRRLGKTGKAVKTGEKLFATDARNPWYCKELTLSYLERGYIKKAISQYEKSWALKVRDAELAATMVALSHKSDYDEFGYNTAMKMIREKKAWSKDEMEAAKFLHTSLLEDCEYFSIRNQEEIFQLTSAFIDQNFVQLGSDGDDLLEKMLLKAAESDVSDKQLQGVFALADKLRDKLSKGTLYTLNLMRKDRTLAAVWNDRLVPEEIQHLTVLDRSKYKTSDLYDYERLDHMLMLLKRSEKLFLQLLYFQDTYPEAYAKYKDFYDLLFNQELMKQKMDEYRAQYRKLSEYCSGGVFYERYPDEKKRVIRESSFRKIDPSADNRKYRRALVGRNEPCPCGSGKKFKKCCMGKGIYD